MLPIFAVPVVYCHGKSTGNIEPSNRQFCQYGYYIGPSSMNVKGAICVAVSVYDSKSLLRTTVTIIVSSKYNYVSD